MFAKEQPRLVKKRQIVSKPAEAVKGPAMAAPNQKALQANNNRNALGEIGNLMGSLNAQCNINKDVVRKRPRTNLVVEANKGASSSTQQFPRKGIVVRAEAKAETGVVWGNKQEAKAQTGVVWGNKRERAIRTKAQYAPAIQNDTAIYNSDSIDSSAQEGGLKARSQLKAREPRVKSMTATLSARSKDSLRDVCEVLPSIDDGDLGNELAVVEYVEDIYKFYRKIENMSCVPPDYIARQVEIEENMRAILIDWLIEVHLKYNLMPETLYLTVNIIDRYLSIQGAKRKELQLVGITAMLIASKYEEIWPPKVNDFVYLSAEGYTSKEIVEMEHTILNQLKFNLTVPTPYVFLVRFLKAAGPDKVALDPLLVLIFIPLFDQVIYPFLEKHVVAMTTIRRLILGMLLCSIAFFTSGLLQLAIDKRMTLGSITSYINTFSDSNTQNNLDHMGFFILAYPNEREKQISILWQVPQYVILTTAEVIFSVSGLEFSYSQAPVSMKSVVQAIWHLTSAEGDLITILIVGIIGNQLSTAMRSFLFAGGGIIAMVFMMWLSACSKDADNPNVDEDYTRTTTLRTPASTTNMITHHHGFGNITGAKVKCTSQ